jgi:hypothetical protein
MAKKDAIAFTLGVFLVIGITGELFLAQKIGCPVWLIATFVAIEYLAAGVAVGWRGSNPFWGTYMGLGFGLAVMAAQLAKLMPGIIPRFQEYDSAVYAGVGLMGVCFVAFAVRHAHDRHGSRNQSPQHCGTHGPLRH